MVTWPAPEAQCSDFDQAFDTDGCGWVPSRWQLLLRSAPRLGIETCLLGRPSSDST